MKFTNTGTAFSTNRFSLWTYTLDTLQPDHVDKRLNGAARQGQADRSELTSAKRYDCNTSRSCMTDSNTNGPVSGQQFSHTFANTLDTNVPRQGQVGNRTQDLGDPDANTTPDAGGVSR